MVYRAVRRTPGMRVDFEDVEHVSILAGSGHNGSIGQLQGHYCLVEVSHEMGHYLLERAIGVAGSNRHVLTRLCRSWHPQDIHHSDYSWDHRCSIFYSIIITA